jgi:D-alanine-D-alanine ligase
VIQNLDRERFEVVPIGVDRDGQWRLGQLPQLAAAAPLKGLRVDPADPAVVLPPVAAEAGPQLVPVPAPAAGAGPACIDVVFPVMHGTYCEDGAVQGLLELADVPYVGPGVLASAVGMDKEVAKRLVSLAGVRVVPWVTVRRGTFRRELPRLVAEVPERLGWPVFVKPASLGSSVGVHKVKGPAELEAALLDAFQYDLKVLIEQAISAREIEVAVLEDLEEGAPLCSVPGEIVPTHEFYSYEAKYLDEHGALLRIPAELSADQAQEARRLAGEIFMALSCEGMARVDLFLHKTTGAIYFNEINTIPGFTSISMYPKLWEASGLSYRELLTRLIELAVARHERRRRLLRERRA